MKSVDDELFDESAFDVGMRLSTLTFPHPSLKDEVIHEFWEQLDASLPELELEDELLLEFYCDE